MAVFLISAFADEAASDFSGQIRALKENGIRYMEVRNVDSRPVFRMEEKELWEMRNQLEAEGLAVSSIGSFLGKTRIEEDFAPVMEDVKKAVRAAHILGARYIRLFSFYMDDAARDTYRDEVITRMQKITDYIREQHVIPCHENESGIYGQDPDRVTDLLASVQGLGGIFDAANYLAHEDDPVEGFLATLPALEYLHVKDCLGGKDRIIVPCGVGDGQYPEILDMTDKAVEGPIFLSVEPHLMYFQGYDNMDALKLRGAKVYDSNEEAFATAVTALKSTLQKLGFKEGENKVWKR